MLFGLLLPAHGVFAACDFQPVLDRYDFRTSNWTVSDFVTYSNGDVAYLEGDFGTATLSQTISGVTPQSLVTMQWWFSHGLPASSGSPATVTIAYNGTTYWTGTTGIGSAVAPASSTQNGATCISGCESLGQAIVRTVVIRLPSGIPANGQLQARVTTNADPSDDVRITDIFVTPTLICLAKQSDGGVGTFDFTTANAQTNWTGGGTSTSITTTSAGVPAFADGSGSIANEQPLLVSNPGASANVQITETVPTWFDLNGMTCDNGLTASRSGTTYTLANVPLDSNATCTVTNTLAAPVADDDNANQPGGSVGATTDLTGNDTFRTGATFTRTGGTCASASVDSGTGLATYNTQASGTCTVEYEVCAPAPNDTVCDTATLTVTSVSSDIAASVSDLDTVSAPGGAVTGEFTCTVSGGTATGVTCTASALDSSGANVPLTVGACTPAVPAMSLPGGTVVTCPFSYATPGLAGGSDTLPTQVTVTAVASSGNDSNAANNSASVSAAIIDAVDDSAGKAANAIGQTSDLSPNDGYPPGSAFTLDTGGTCANASVSGIGLATYDVPASGSCTVNYEVCAPAPDAAVCDTATLTVTAVVADMSVALSGLPAVVAPGDTVSGTLTCTASINNAANVTCGASALDSLGGPVPVTVANCTVNSAPVSLPLASLNNGDSIVCDISYSAPGTAGGSDTAPTSVTLTGSTGATNDTNFGNNQATATTPIIDAVDDFPGYPGGTTGATSNLGGNDGAPSGSSFTATAGGTCTNASVSGAGLATYDVPASGTCTVNYQVCAPAPNATVCDTATMTVTATPSDMTPTFTGLPAALSPGQSVSVPGGLICTNIIGGPEGSAAVGPTCTASAQDNLGNPVALTVSNCAAVPPPFNPLDVWAHIACDIAFTVPGTAGGGDTMPTHLTLTGNSTAINDNNAGNNTTLIALPLIDGVDDFAGVPGGSGSQSTQVGGNDSYPPGSVFTELPGGDCANQSISPTGQAVFDAPPLAGTCTIAYQVCAPDASGVPPEPCDQATLTVTATPADVSATFSGLPSAIGPGDTVSGTLTCTNAVTSSGDATNVTCVPSVPGGSGSIGNVVCSPVSGSDLAAGASMACTFDYTAPTDGDGGTTSAAAFYTLTGTASASNDDNPGNNVDTADLVLMDAADDSASHPGGSTGASSSLADNDFPPGSTYTPTGGTCPNRSVSSGGIASYDVPASGTCTVEYEVCAPAPNQAACDTATLTVTATPADMAGAFSGFPTVAGPGQTVSGTLTCTNVGSTDAIGATCSASADSGVTLALSCSPTPPATVAPAGTIVCAVSYTAPGTAGGTDNPIATVTLTAATGATNDSNSANDANATTSTALIDALNDSYGAFDIVSGGNTASVLANDTVGSLAASGRVTVSPVSQSGPATALILNADGTVTVPPGAAIGTYTLTYRICSTAEPDQCDTADATVSVTDSISAAPDSGATPAGQSVTIEVTGNDTVPPGATVSTGGTSSQGGTVVCGGSTPGSCTYTPPNGFVGSDSFTYTVCAPAPNQTLCDTETVSVTVTVAQSTQPIPIGPGWLIALTLGFAAMRVFRQQPKANP